MALTQINQSFQNDGNFSLLDLKSTNQDGKIMRIETFRCSHPEAKTVVGSTSKAICGKDHLTSISNRVFRHIFSVEEDKKMNCTLEIREVFNEAGSWEIRTRDIDHNSKSFGSSTIIKCDCLGKDSYLIKFIFLQIETNIVPISSPVQIGICDQATDLPDLSEDLGTIIFEDTVTVSLTDNIEIVNFKMKEVRSFVEKNATYSTWKKNICVYEEFGNFRDKCIHPGINLTGPNKELASEYLLIRAYRGSLIYLACIFDLDMYSYYGLKQTSLNSALEVNTKPGVYSIFLSAYIFGIGIYQLGIDKVHSDYGGIPMALAPGSRLETGIQPIVCSKKANQTLAFLAGLFYQPQVLEMHNVYSMFKMDKIST